MATNPALGLGFGYDLARGFLQEYNPDMAEDFTARSPHNVLLSALGRMGLVGLGLFLLLLGVLFSRTWRVLRNPESDATQVALWAGIWTIIVSAHLGVVLEGPMGAVVFWSLLGLADSYRSAPTVEDGQAAETTEPIEARETSALATAPRRAT
jgi:O-antigen ligase